MARHNISNAEDLFSGEAQFGPANSALNGIPLTPLFLIDLGAPITLDTNGLIVAATSTELPDTETVTYTFPVVSASPQDGANVSGVLATPRNITCLTTHGSSIVAMTVLVTGTDVYGIVMSELITIAATGTSEVDVGAKAFATVTSIAITASADAEANTLNMGWGDVLGLPYRVDVDGILSVVEAGLPIAATAANFVPAVTTDPATTTTGDVRGTYIPETAADGTLTIQLLAKVAGRATKVEAYGIDQV